MFRFRLLLVLAIAGLLGACKSDIPENVLDETTMEHLLYDYHLAQGMANAASDSVPYKTRLYCNAVFKKYGISEADFNKSMEWYTRHSEDLLAIYKKVNERLETSATALGASASEASDLAGRAHGDTANVWKGTRFALLSSNSLNRFTFTQKADTAYQPGDRLTWQFSTQWVYREGTKSAIAVLAVRYENDSVDSSVQYIYNTGLQKVVLTTKKQPIKEISGVIYQNAPQSDSPKLLFVSQLALIRFHLQEEEKPVEVPAARVDSDSTRWLIDSIQGKNQKDDGKPHFKEIETPEQQSRANNPRAFQRS